MVMRAQRIGCIIRIKVVRLFHGLVVGSIHFIAYPLMVPPTNATPKMEVSVPTGTLEKCEYP